MKKVAIIKPCEKRDIDPDRPLKDQKVCLYAHPKTPKEKKKGHGKLLGRHPNEESAVKQEKAIKARQSAIRRYVSTALLDEFSVLNGGSDFTRIADICVNSAMVRKRRDLKEASETVALKYGISSFPVDAMYNRAIYLINAAEKKLDDVHTVLAEDTSDDTIQSSDKYSIWWNGADEVWVVSSQDDQISIPLEMDKHSTTTELISAALSLDLPGDPSRKDFLVIPFSGDTIYGEVLGEDEDMHKKQASGWEGEPKGWTNKSKEQFFESLGGSVSECIKKMEGDVDDPEAFCASLADEVEGTAWRHKPRKGNMKKKAEVIVVNGVRYVEAHGATVTDKVKDFFKSLSSSKSDAAEGGTKSCGCGRRSGGKVVKLPTDCVEEVIGVAFGDSDTTVFEKKGDTWLVNNVDSNGVIDDPLIMALVSYCEMNKTANHFARLAPDGFMRPEIVKDTFYLLTDDTGETIYVPAEFLDSKDVEQAKSVVEDGRDFNVKGTSLEDFVLGDMITDISEEKGWFARLSAPGYLDATEWSGPFDSEKEAEEYLDEMYGEDEWVDEDEYGLPPVDEEKQEMPFEK